MEKLPSIPASFVPLGTRATLMKSWPMGWFVSTPTWRASMASRQSKLKLASEEGLNCMVSAGAV